MQSDNTVRIALAGGVGSSLRILDALLRHRANVVRVFSLDPADRSTAAGFVDLATAARERGLPVSTFQRINSEHLNEELRSLSPDVFFVVGLSQLVRKSVLEIPRLGCVGFHPTLLPRGRGRAPVAWLTLDGTPGAATFFAIDEGMDSGPILVQEPFQVGRFDYANDVEERMYKAIDRALDRWLPSLVQGEWAPVEQEHALATYNGKRQPEDGRIDWHTSASEIHLLVRAAPRPHPGAYTYYRGGRMLVWRAHVAQDRGVRGVVGRIVEVSRSGQLTIQTGNGLITVTEHESPEGARPPVVGGLLGYRAEDEIHLLRRRTADLEEKFERLNARLDALSRGDR